MKWLAASRFASALGRREGYFCFPEDKKKNVVIIYPRHKSIVSKGGAMHARTEKIARYHHRARFVAMAHCPGAFDIP
jgi:hypothetical protein